MGFGQKILRSLTGRTTPVQSRPRHRFDSPPKPIDELFAELYAAGSAGAPVSRDEALAVPAVQRGRNLICSISTLPLVQIGPKQQIVDNPLLRQLDPDVANIVTLAQTVEDLVFDSISWWEITAQDFDGFPVAVRHRDVSSVSLTPPGRVRPSPAPLPSGEDPRGASVWVDGVQVAASRMIRFDSPNPAVRKVCARAIRRALLLDKAAAMYADDPRPLDYFTPAEGADPADDTEVEGFLGKWKAARKKRSTAYVPLALKYNSVDSPSPQELQLVELQKQTWMEIANSLGIDPEELGVSTTSRTYFNAVDRRQSRVNDVLAPYMKAITDRLSMGDVTRRGHRVQFDLTDYLKPDPAGRIAYYEGLRRLGVITPEQIAAAEGLPPPPPKAAAPAPAEPAPAALAEPGADQPDGMQAAAGPQWRLAGDLVTFDMPVTGFAVDTERRTIEGLAMPYGKYAQKYGMKFRFDRNSLRWTDPGRIKLLRDHDITRPLGKGVSVRESHAGVWSKYKVVDGPDGDEALALAMAGVLDGLSAGVDFDMAADTVPDPNDDSAVLVRRADWRETSLTAVPAFDDARVTKVAASRDGRNAMEECATCGQRHAPGVACPTQPAPQQQPPQQQPEPATTAGFGLNQEQLTTLLTRPGALEALVRPATQPQNQQPATPPGALTLSAEQVDALIQSGQMNALLGLPALPGGNGNRPVEEPRQVVNPTSRPAPTTFVHEPPSYRFDARGILQPAKHDFGLDMIAALKGGNNPEAAEHRRVMEFIRAQFAVVSTDVNELSPTINLPKYIDQREFRYPIWSAVNKGAPPNGIQPFQWPKFSSSSGLVGAHVEGTEPATTGTYVTTSQSVTPTPNSGKAKISRETWDMGGMPGISDLIWRQMTRSWFEALEAAIVAELDAATPTSLGTFTAGGGANQTLAKEITQNLSKLHFVRGGFTFEMAFSQIDLYQHLASAVDTTGRPIFPAIGPTNADGTVSNRFQSINVNGVPFLPAWALAATTLPTGTPTSSYLIDPVAVDGWASVPSQLIIDQTEVANVYIGLWGYKATAINDINGVREIIYDPV